MIMPPPAFSQRTAISTVLKSGWPVSGWVRTVAKWSGTESEVTPSADMSVAVSGTGAVLGTSDYMPPEVLHGGIGEA